MRCDLDGLAKRNAVRKVRVGMRVFPCPPRERKHEEEEEKKNAEEEEQSKEEYYSKKSGKRKAGRGGCARLRATTRTHRSARLPTAQTRRPLIDNAR